MLQFQPDANEHGSTYYTHFEYALRDKVSGATSEPANVTFRVEPLNDAPSAVSGAVVIPLDQSRVSIDLTAVDPDKAGQEAHARIHMWPYAGTLYQTDADGVRGEQIAQGSGQVFELRQWVHNVLRFSSQVCIARRQPLSLIVFDNHAPPVCRRRTAEYFARASRTRLVRSVPTPRVPPSTWSVLMTCIQLLGYRI